MRRLVPSALGIAIAAVLVPVGARATTTSCNIPQPCAVLANNSGVALQGESAGADGVLGEASSGTIYGAGVEGESLKQTGADAAGTFGLTLLSSGVAPNYGVVAYGSLYGVYGQAGNTGLSSTGPGFGVFGQDNAGSRYGDYNSGVTGLSKNGVGVLAEGGGSPSTTYYGEGVPIGLYAVAKATNSNLLLQSIGIVAESDSIGAIVENTVAKDHVDIAGPSYALTLTTSSGNPFFFDYSGDETLTGTLSAKDVTSVHGGPYLRTTGASGTTVTAYSDHTTAPEMEDLGEAQLVNGRAFVPIDAALADVIDLRGGYHVFITPEGENKGLYVVKGAGGFFVREQQGGRSTLAFDYRIVAKPREENGARLAHVAEVAPHVDPRIGAGRIRSKQIPLPLSPEELLKRKIGPRAYAEIMTALNKRFASLPSGSL
jgi:hypothetical protein